MNKIMVKDLFTIAYSDSKAVVLREEIEKMLQYCEQVVVDFTGVGKFTALFFNSCTGYLLHIMGQQEYDKKIKIVGLIEDAVSVYDNSYNNTVKGYNAKEREALLKIIEELGI